MEVLVSNDNKTINKITKKQKNKMTEKEKIALLEDILELEEGTLTPETELSTSKSMTRWLNYR